MAKAKLAAAVSQVWHATRKAQPDPNGNRAQRRAAAKRAKRKKQGDG
jgi:hypothetical protein